ncbi:hypothetical protein [Paenibacillus sp. FSL H3-0286]|uniref:hypothetical protein n=1 Tax=Paenibacillus sp. FSL H3-0286 TaxID=2921427 RepID=UPI00324FA52B
MDKFDFKAVDEYITNIANGLLANSKTKKLAQTTLLKMLVMSCQEYESNPYFRKDIEKLDMYLKGK